MLREKFSWAIGGEAGFGINSSGLIFSKTLTRLGLNIFDYLEYPSLIRGGHNVYFVNASKEEVFSQEKGIDILVALNKETVNRHYKKIRPKGIIIYDSNHFEIKNDFGSRKINLVPVPAQSLVQKVGAEKVMINNVTLGASVSLLGLDLKSLFSVIEDIFGQKGREVVEKNKKAAQAGFNFVQKKFKTSLIPLSIPKRNKEKKLVLSGNEAISLGVVLGGCKFFASYPMTPASSILHNLAFWAKKIRMVVKHAEDEISVINMAIGASFAGVRSAVATSGGGFALMEEGVSLAGITETPLVVIEAQRPAPATGMPTWTEQGDLEFILRSGHGEFPKIVLAPGDQEEAFWLTAESFNLAEIYQCPVFVISDKYLSESHKSIKGSMLKAQGLRFKIERGKLLTVASRKSTDISYKRYKITDDGISPRAVPGVKGYIFQANSYEHLEDGHTTEDAKERTRQVDKRARKMETFVKNLPKPKLYGEEDAKVTLVGWGSTKMPVLQAIGQWDSEAMKPFNYLHLNYLWPFPKEAVAKILNRAKKVLLLEGNSTGQLGQLIRQETGIEIKNKYLKYDGRPFYPEEIIEKIKNLK